MFSRVATSTLVALLAACSRTTEAPQPKVIAEPVRDASPEAAALDGGAQQPVGSPSLFTLVARAPTALATRYEWPVDELAHPMPLVQRLPGGGLVIASEYARARAEGPGPLSVELFGRGFDFEILYRPAVTMSYYGLRWVWSDATLSIAIDETETSRNGPRLASYKLKDDGFQLQKASVGYWSAVQRDGSVLALERTAYEVPNSSIYPKGSGMEQNSWSLRPARIAVLSGKAVAPAIPVGVCPSAMSAAADGTLVVAVDGCAGEAGRDYGVLRFAPSATQAKVEWLSKRKTNRESGELEVLVVAAASVNEVHVAAGDRLDTWSGKQWTSSQPFPDESFGSLSRAPNGELWAVIRNKGRVVKRGADGVTWSPVTLPSAPADRLDVQAYALPTMDTAEFLKVDDPPEGLEVRALGASEVTAYSVDATTEEVLVLATVQHEAFLFSTKPRVPIARLPSIPVQRARLAQTLPRKLPSPRSPCDNGFLTFPETTTVDALRASLGDAGATQGDAGKSTARIGEAIVEGKKRLVVYGDVFGAAKRLAPLEPRRLCGPPVIERAL